MGKQILSAASTISNTNTVYGMKQLIAKQCRYPRPLDRKPLLALELASKELTETFKSLFSSSSSLSEISSKNSIDNLDNFFEGKIWEEE